MMRHTEEHVAIGIHEELLKDSLSRKANRKVAREKSLTRDRAKRQARISRKEAKREEKLLLAW